MPAAKPLQTTPQPQRTPAVLPPMDQASSVHLASEIDAPAPSPVQALQDRLAEELAIKQQRFDLTWLAILLFSGACWWAVIGLGVMLLRGWNGG
jgi:hypothetical protein